MKPTKVKVKVTRTTEGTVVEADCQCFGYSFRVHSNPMCPLLQATSRMRDKRPDRAE